MWLIRKHKNHKKEEPQQDYKIEIIVNKNINNATISINRELEDIFALYPEGLSMDSKKLKITFEPLNKN